MNPSLTSTLSEFTKKSEYSKGGLAAELSDEPPLHPSELNLATRARLWLGKLVPFAFVRFLVIFFIGVTTTLAWQSYGGAARKAVAGWSPRLSWLAPSASSERIRAMSLALAAARQNLDKVANEMSRLEAQSGDVPRRRSAR